MLVELEALARWHTGCVFRTALLRARAAHILKERLEDVLKHFVSAARRITTGDVREEAVRAARRRKALRPATRENFEHIAEVLAARIVLHVHSASAWWHAWVLVVRTKVVLAARLWVLELFVGLLDLLELLGL